MALRANITSIEAIESFRAHLIIYLSKAKPALEEVSAEIVRTRVWLQNNQRLHWEEVFKKRARQLEEAKAALFSSKMSTLHKVTAAEQLAVTKAKRALDEAESKLRTIRRWEREYENQVEPMSRKLEKMQVVLTDDLEKAVAFLAQTVQTLDAYARIAPSIDPQGAPGASSSAETAEPETKPESETEVTTPDEGGPS
jgi:hypothetical protein